MLVYMKIFEAVKTRMHPDQEEQDNLAKEDALWRELADTDDFLKSEAVYLKYSREMISSVIY